MADLTIDQMMQAVIDAGYTVGPNTDPLNQCLFVAAGPAGAVLGDDENTLISVAYQITRPTAG